MSATREAAQAADARRGVGASRGRGGRDAQRMDPTTVSNDRRILMPQLQFTRDLADAIRAGRKSQTLCNSHANSHD
jgi:hypothetical protein